MRRVIVESPFQGYNIKRNEVYMTRCLKSVIDMGGAPFASHAIYPQVLDEDDPKQRALGIQLGYAFWQGADSISFFLDYGMSEGMEAAYERAVSLGMKIEVSFIGKNEGEDNGEPAFVPSGNTTVDSLVRASIRDGGVSGTSPSDVTFIDPATWRGSAWLPSFWRRLFG